jgi:hypothetical protein
MGSNITSLKTMNGSLKSILTKYDSIATIPTSDPSSLIFQ